MNDFLRSTKAITPDDVKSLTKRALKKAEPISKQAAQVLELGTGAIGASLSRMGDIPFDPSQIAQIQNVVTNHGVTIADAVKALPDELTRYGTQVVEQFLKGGDANGKQWSHIVSQESNPKRAADPKNAVWEDGSTNMARGSRDMTLQERMGASLDNHLDALLSTVRTQEFWQRTLGNAFEASVYAAALTAIDQLLIHRDELLNATTERKKDVVIEILKSSGLMAAGALPVSVFLAVALLVIPGLSVVMAPLGLVGTVGLSMRLIASLTNNPSQQEKDFLKAFQGHLQGLIYDIQKSITGTLTINVRPIQENMHT